MRRIRRHLGLWGLVATLALAATFVAAAAPRAMNRVEDNGLRRMIAEAPSPTRDLRISHDLPPVLRPDVPVSRDSAAELRDRFHGLLPLPVRDRVAWSWAGYRTRRAVLQPAPGVPVEPDGLTPFLTAVLITDIDQEVDLVGGRVPDGPPTVHPHQDGEPGVDEIEIMVSAAVGERLGLRLGNVYELKPSGGAAVRISVIGVFTPRDPAGTFWEAEPSLLTPGLQPDRPGQPGEDIPQRLFGAVATDEAGLDVLLTHRLVWAPQNWTRYRIDENRVDAGTAGELRAAVSRTRSDPLLRGLNVQTGLDELLDEFAHRAAAVRALFAVVLAGIVGAAAGLLALAARLAVARRREELRLLRARGCSVPRLLARLAAEALPVVLPAAALGWLAHLLVPGRSPGGPSWGPAVVAGATALAVPLAAALAFRYAERPTRRSDVSRLRTGRWRLTVEITIVVVAAVGVLLLHRRGLMVAGVDPYLSAVPLLIGVAAGLVALRLYPPPIRLFGRLAARRRGAVAHLGLARAGRVGPAAVLPLVALVLAVAVGGFAGSVRSGVAQARDVAVAREVGAHLRLAAPEFPDGAAGRADAVSGVDAAAEVYLAPAGALRSGEAADPQIVLAVVDGPAYARVLSAMGLEPPAGLSGPAAGDGALPAIASSVAADLPGLGIQIGGTVHPLRVTGVATEAPGLSGRQFVVVTRWPAGVDLSANTLLVAGRSADPAAVRQAVKGPGMVDELLTEVRFADRRAALERAGFNDGITLAFGAGTLAALVAGLLAVGLGLMVEAPARGRALSLLRTMGLSVRQARRLLLAELVPMVAVALLVGVAVGVALPVLLGPSLGLTAFTAGVTPPPGLDAATSATLAALSVVLLWSAVFVEAAANRRLGLGRALRLGSGE